MKKLMTVLAVVLFAVGCSAAKSGAPSVPAVKAVVAPTKAKTVPVVPVRAIPPHKRIAD